MPPDQEGTTNVSIATPSSTPAPSTVFAVDTNRRTNATLIAELAIIGYLHDSDLILDVTYGFGGFWTSWRPELLVGTDIVAERSPVGESVDFRALPFPDASFDVAVIDPPYKLNGTSTGKGASALDGRYGIADGYMRWRERHQMIREGIAECVRVARRGGLVLVKCQDQVSSGKVRWQTIEFASYAMRSLGCELVDQLHVTGHRKQPAGIAQQHAARNYSTLLVLERRHLDVQR